MFRFAQNYLQMWCAGFVWLTKFKDGSASGDYTWDDVQKRILIWYQPYSDLSCPKSNLTITQLDVDVKDLFQNENTVLLHVSSVQCPSEKQTKIKSNYSAHAQKKQPNIFIGTLSLWKTRIICSNLVLFTKIIKIFFWACQIELKAEVISCDFASLALSIHMMKNPDVGVRMR